MALLNQTNYNDVPDVNPPIANGIYDLRVNKEEVKPNNAGTGNNLVLSLEVMGGSNPEMVKRKLNHYMSMDNEVQIKRAFKSAGVAPDPTTGALNTDDIHGKIIKAEIASSVYEDKQTKQMKESANVKNILIPGDANY